MHPQSKAKAEIKLNSVGHSLSHVATVVKENAIDILGELDAEAEDGSELSKGSQAMEKVGQRYQLWADSLLDTAAAYGK